MHLPHSQHLETVVHEQKAFLSLAWLAQIFGNDDSRASRLNVMKSAYTFKGASPEEHPND